MSATQSIAFIGAGQMAEALIGGLLAAGVYAPDQIRASDPSPARRDVMKAKFGIVTESENRGMASQAEVLVLAVKPQICESVLKELAPALQTQLMISIAAGIRLSWLRARVPPGVRLIRVMPNAPALVGAGMSVLALEASASAADAGLARRLCGAVGRVEVVEETWLDAVTGLSGSGPAFVFAAIEALADGGVKAGLPRDLAERFVVGTAAGTAKMVLDGGLTGSHREVGAHVRGPARDGEAVLNEGGFRLAVAQAVEAAARRSKELGA